MKFLSLLVLGRVVQGVHGKVAREHETAGRHLRLKKMDYLKNPFEDGMVPPPPKPTPSPTKSPVEEPGDTPAPTAKPTPSPTKSPVEEPVDTPEPTAKPTPSPTKSPVEEPVDTPAPTAKPTSSPTQSPVEEPTAKPTVSPTPAPQTPAPVGVPPTPEPTEAYRFGDLPRARAKPWDSLTQEEQDYATQAGWTAATWNEPGSASFEGSAFEELTASQQSALQNLGFDEDLYDCYINHYDAYDWDEMPSEAITGLELLGWSEASWNGEAPAPESDDKDWEELTPSEMTGAENICFFEELWDGIPVDEW